MKKLSTVKRNKSSIGLFTKIPMRMRITPFLLAGFLMQANAENVYSQSAAISIEMNNATVEEVLNEIEMNSGYHFLYNNQLIDVDRKVSVKADADNIESVLHDLFDGTNVAYKIVNKQIVLGPKQNYSVAETKVIKGNIVDNNGDPIIGANIRVKGTSTGTISDIDGNFTLEIDENAQLLEVSYIGYETRDIPLKGQKELKIVLKEDTETLDEVVVVGYGTTSKRKATAAISSVNADDIAKTPVPDVTQSLAGRAPGLIITQSGGSLGTTANISIRGGGTPLFVIDDVISEARDFENLNPEDIEQMSVLKDASATAVYGARAANGIILVTTKQGKVGKMNVDYNFNYDLSCPSYLPEKLSSYDVLNYQNISRINDGMAIVTSEEDLQKYKDGTDPYKYPNTNWQEVCMRDFAPSQRHTLAIRGGNETLKVYSALGYYDQESIYRTNSNNMQRYNFRTNIVATFKDLGLKFNSGVEAYIWDIKEPYTHQGRGASFIWSHIQNRRAFELDRNQFGQIFSGTSDNPLIDISSDGGYFKQQRSTVKGNVGLEWSLPFLQGLKLKALGSYAIANDRDKAWQKTPICYDLEGNPNEPSKPNLTKNTYYHRNFTTQFLANYNHTFTTEHTVDALLGLEASGSDYDNNSLSRQEYLLDIDQIVVGPVNTAKNSSAEGVNYRRASLIGRVKYDYAAKYIAEASMRYDGSDYFPKDNRWGLFFSGSLAWVISEEEFWESLKEKHIFDMFKIRGSYGEIGLDGSTDNRLGRYEYMQSYIYNDRGGYIGQQFYPGFSEGALVSSDITWYTSKNMNVGFDFASLNNRLSGTVEYFRMSTTGYLASPSNVGYTAPLGTSLPKVKSNGESIRQGAEFLLSWQDNIGELKYNISGNLTFYQDRWNINPDESEVDLKNPYKRSTQVGSYWGLGYNCLGYYQNYEDIMNSPKRPESVNLGAGDLKYEDFNGDGIIDDNDQYRIGHASSPRMNYGLSLGLEYKGWFMNMLWQGAGSYNIHVGSSLMGGGNQSSTPVIYDFQEDFWTPNNTGAAFPRLRNSAGYVGNNNTVTSSFWLVDAKYIRLKNLSIGYDFKHKLLKNIGWLTKCSVSLSGYNILTFSPAKKYGMDPEIGDGNLYNYPVPQIYSVSLNLGF